MMNRRRVLEARPTVISRHGTMTLYRVDDEAAAQRLPWHEQMGAEFVLPVYVVIKANQPYAMVHSEQGVAVDAQNERISADMAQELAPLFTPLAQELEKYTESGSEFANDTGIEALANAVMIHGEGTGETGEIDDLMAEPAEEPDNGPVPRSRLGMGGPRTAPPKANVHPTKGQLGDPLKGMQQMSGGDVDTLISRARTERDPSKAAALRQQSLSAMQQESRRRGLRCSRVQCWVNRLLS